MMVPLLRFPLLLFVLLHGCDGAIRFANSYGDHMVLQRAPQHAVIWGHADKNSDKVTVEIQGHGSPVTTVTANNMWKVKLPVMSDEGPFTITASSSEGSISLKDVLFGDVWVCSGQSNMKFPVSWLNNTEDEVKRSLAFNKIRTFHVDYVESKVELVELKKVLTPWTAPANDTIRSFSALCLMYGEYLFNHRKYPIGLIEADWGGTPIEHWSSPDAINVCSANRVKRGPRTNNILWNAMIAPITSQTIYGTIWYQGESNGANPPKYACQFPAMIKDWRQKFHQNSLGETSLNFPFGFVQLAGNKNDSNRIAAMPSLRWSQTAEVGHVPNSKMPNTFMAVAMDLPDFASPHGPVHPRYKQDVADRLGLAGLAVAYGEKGLNYQGPYPSSFEYRNKENLTIEYDEGSSVLDIRSSSGFEICCSPSTHPTCMEHDHWAPAPIISHHGAHLTLNMTGCQYKHVTGLRYSWRESPCLLKQCAVYGRDNDLPGPPFINYLHF